MKISCFKKLSDRFSIGQKIGLIDPASIEQRTSQTYSNQIFNHKFDQSSNRFGRLKMRKNKNFEKQSILMQKLLKVQCFMNKMHEYEMKSFSKTLEFNPDLPKTRFSINLSSNLKLLILDGHNKITQYNVPSLAKSNLCNVCN